MNDKYARLLPGAQKYISQNYSAALANGSDLNPYIEKYVRDLHEINEAEIDSAVAYLAQEMSEYSVLTPLLAANNVSCEEVNINSWDDITSTMSDGSRVKSGSFRSPEHAADIVKRLLHHSNIIIDSATPVAQGHLPNNMRITALLYPIVDKDVGVAASIRRLNPQRITRKELISSGFTESEMYDFICACSLYGVSFVVAGATSSGKTTLLNAVLAEISDDKRIITIESGSRELSLVRRTDGKITNNVVHLLSRASDNPLYDVSQEDLVVAAMRLTPNIICVGEVRDVEAHSAIEAAQTGHAVVTTVHARTPQTAHDRIADLSHKKYPTEFATILRQVAQAFPIVICTKQLADKKRRITEICECVVTKDDITYHTLYKYHVTENRLVNGKFIVNGHFERLEEMSDSLRTRMIDGGIPLELLNKFVKGDSSD